jgi:hypothetical protein
LWIGFGMPRRVYKLIFSWIVGRMREGRSLLGASDGEFPGTGDRLDDDI